MLRSTARTPRLRIPSPSRSPSRSTRTRARSPLGVRSLATIAPGATHAPRTPPPSPGASSSSVRDTKSYFEYTSGRWLYNEKEQLAVRRSPFKVDALEAAVFKAADSEVDTMVKKEGMFNKSFMCTLKDGRKVTARIKNPVAGPVHFTTASEVATMDFVRTVLKVPVPKVLDYCSNADPKSVNAEYIIMENAPGVQLDKVWNDLDDHDKTDIVNSLTQIEQRLLKAKFTSYGNLYYKEDVLEQYRSGPLLAEGSTLDSSATAKCNAFCIGPTANTSYHEDERATMPDLDRGPWSTESPEKYLKSIAEKEHAWIGKHAKNNIHDDPARALLGTGEPQEHLEALHQYQSIIPALIPAQGSQARSSVLWHPDLNLGNVFVEKRNGRYEISQIIDWQGSSAAPAYLQMKTPAFLKAQLHTSHSNVSQAQGRESPESPEILQKHYDSNQPQGYSVSDHYTMSSPVFAAGRTWKDGILPLRLALLDVALNWQNLNTPDVPCPLKFDRHDVELLTRDEDRWLQFYDFHEYLRSSFGIRSYGWVGSAQEYDRKHSILDKIWQEIPLTVKEEANAVFPRGWWPFQDTL